MKSFCDLELKTNVSDITLKSLVRKCLLKYDILPYLSVIDCRQNDESAVKDELCTPLKDAYLKLSDEDCSLNVS